MTEDRTRRRLAAILAADVVGYSRLMGQDETGTLAALKALRSKVLDPKIAEHSGRVFNSTGDGLLAEFPSVVNAVGCAVAIQQAVSEGSTDKPIQIRIGINLGDVIVEGGDVFGDGVNVAARIEALAPAGGIAITETVREHLGTKLNLRFKDWGEQSLKNIERLVRVLVLDNTGLNTRTPEERPPDKPSIAVLPFQNMSGDPEQEYFADGVVEEIITALSRFRQLVVIARNSSFIYKGKSMDVKQVGRELGVRYVLEGSIRKAGNKVRIAGQLIDTSTGSHIWADRFDGGLEDIFDLQDQVTAKVVGALSPKLEQAEIDRSRRKPTENFDAYDYFLRGLAGLHRWTKESTGEALSDLYRAIDLDPDFASAYGIAARCYVARKGSGWIADQSREYAEAIRLARRAAALGKDDAVALGTAGLTLAVIGGEHDDGKLLTDQALALNPNLAWAWLFSGWVRCWGGEAEAAIERVSHALRLNPTDPHSFSMYSVMALAHFFSRRFDDATLWAERAAREKPDVLLPIILAAASNAHAGRHEQAKKAIDQVRRIDPALRMSNLEGRFPIRRSQDFELFAEGLRKAGLPE